MIKSILFFLFVILSIIAAPMLIEEQGYILISFYGQIIESTVITAIVVFVLALLSLIFLIAVLRGTVRIGSKGWQTFAFANRRKAMNRFQQGMTALLLGDNKGAEDLLSKSADGLSHYRGLVDTAWLGAATAANRQGLTSNTKHYLTLIEQNSTPDSKASMETLILKAQLLISEEKYQAARNLLDGNHKLIGHDIRLMSQEINLCLIEERFQAAIDNLVTARKMKGLAESQLAKWEQAAYGGQFNHLITKHSLGELEAYWLQIPKKLRKHEIIILAYALVLANHNITDKLVDLLLPAFTKSANKGFLAQAKTLPVKRGQPLITALEKQLKKSPDDADLLSALGHMAINCEDYNLAAKAFTKLFEQQKSQTDLLAYASVLEHQGQFQQAATIYKSAIT